MPNDFKSMRRVYRVNRPYFYARQENGEYVMGAEMPSISIQPKGNKQIIEVKEDSGWTPWIVGGLLGVGAGLLLASYSKKSKIKILKSFKY